MGNRRGHKINPEKVLKAYAKQEYEGCALILGLLRDGLFPVDLIDEDEQTALHHAARMSDVRFVKELVAYGADPNAQDWRGQTPLHTSNSVEGVSLLVDAGADIEKRDHDGITPLMYAVTRKDNIAPYVVRALLENGANVFAKYRDGSSVLDHASIYSRHVIEDHIAKIMSGPAHGDIPLTESAGLILSGRISPSPEFLTAVNAGYLDRAMKMLEGASVETLSSYLFHAIDIQNEDLIRMLIDAGADPRATHREGETILHDVINVDIMPTESLFKFIVDLAKEHGFLSAVRRRYGHTPLHQAIDLRNPLWMIRMLIDAGADLEAKNLRGQTPLEMAIGTSNQFNIAILLIRAGANVTKPMSNGRSYLVKAIEAQNDNDALVEELLDAGAEPFQVDEGGRDMTAMEMVQRETYSRFLVPVRRAIARKMSGTQHGDIQLTEGVDPELDLAHGNFAGLDIPKEIRSSDEAFDDFMKHASHHALSLALWDLCANPSDERFIYKLIDAGADPGVHYRGRTSIFNLIDAHQLPSEELFDKMVLLMKERDLLDAKAKSSGSTVLHVAVKRQAPPWIIRKLIEAGADIEAKTKDGFTPLGLAMKAQNISFGVFRALISLGADPNEPFPDGSSCLAEVIKRDNDGFLEDLLEAGADPLIAKDSHGTPVMQMASYAYNSLRFEVPLRRAILKKMSGAGHGDIVG